MCRVVQLGPNPFCWVLKLPELMFKYHISFICTQIATKSLIFFSAEVTCYFVCSFICPIITTDSSNFSLCELYDFPPTHTHTTVDHVDYQKCDFPGNTYWNILKSYFQGWQSSQILEMNTTSNGRQPWNIKILSHDRIVKGHFPATAPNEAYRWTGGVKLIRQRQIRALDSWSICIRHRLHYKVNYTIGEEYL